jgi:hypothetical protein
VSNVEWFGPGIVISAILAGVVSGFVGRRVGTRPLVAWLLVFSLGTIFAATLTPIHGALETGSAGVGTCDLSRFGPARLADLRTLNDTSLNVLLFLPLGAAIGFLPDRRRKVAITAGAIALPFAIEGVQLLATSLHRGCQSADVADNLTGLLLGFAAGQALRLFGGLVAPREGAPDVRPDRPNGRD